MHSRSLQKQPILMVRFGYASSELRLGWFDS